MAERFVRNREHKNEYMKQLYQKNKEEIKSKVKEYVNKIPLRDSLLSNHYLIMNQLSHQDVENYTSKAVSVHRT